MDNAIINNWNSVVSRKDTVYLLGDVAFVKTRRELSKYRSRFNGRIVLIKGNHDDKVVWRNRDLFSEAYDSYLERSIEGIKFTLCHYALKVWNGSHKGNWHLFGHSHGTLPDDLNSLSFDVGVDCHNFYPISMDQVKEIMSKKKFKPLDHHRQYE